MFMSCLGWPYRRQASSHKYPNGFSSFARLGLPLVSSWHLHLCRTWAPTSTQLVSEPVQDLGSQVLHWLQSLYKTCGSWLAGDRACNASAEASGCRFFPGLTRLACCRLASGRFAFPTSTATLLLPGRRCPGCRPADGSCAYRCNARPACPSTPTCRATNSSRLISPLCTMSKRLLPDRRGARVGAWPGGRHRSG